jgi:hypothetical protein
MWNKPSTRANILYDLRQTFKGSGNLQGREDFETEKKGIKPSMQAGLV